MIEEGLYPVSYEDEARDIGKYKRGKWQWIDCVPGPRVTRYLPIRLPDPFAKQRSRQLTSSPLGVSRAGGQRE